MIMKHYAFVIKLFNFILFFYIHFFFKYLVHFILIRNDNYRKKSKK